MCKALAEFGMSSLGLIKDDFLRKGIITQIGYPPLRIDILNEIDGVSFKDAYVNKLIIDVDGLMINYIGLDDLIKNKTVSGRHQDLTDANTLKKLKKKL
ncbi:MAG: nucleotidyltransferase family protein [Mucilaginibacter sp.]|nr:nucleotidyltransferase family protein [Mucilaginibacter sp.]